MNPREIFFQALNNFKEGNIEKAETLCKQLLQINAKEVNTLRLYGQIQQRKGQLTEAEKAFNMVISLAKDYGHAYMDLGQLKKQQGELAAAEQHLKQAIAIDSNLKLANTLLHEVLLEQGKEQEASGMSGHFEHREKVSELVKQAHQAFRDGENEKLEQLSKQILDIDPSNVAILLILADYASSKLNPRRAEKLYQQILKAAPENWRAWNGLCRAQLFQDKTDIAQESLKRSKEINPSASETQIMEAETLIKNYEYEKGTALLQNILDQDPQLNGARSQLGLALKTIGQQEQAIKEFRQCLSQDETFGEAYWALSDMKTFSFTDEDISKMESVLEDESLKEKNQVYFGYAIGKAYEHKKDYRKAFSFYEQANRTQKTITEYSATENSKLTDEIINTYHAGFFNQLRQHSNFDVTPVFVVGLPRSGSTLQEQILASHSQIEGTQELPFMPRIAKRMTYVHSQSKNLKDAAGHLTPDNLKAAAKHYLKQAEYHRQEKAPFFIDKLPNNFAHVGLILALFPNAKIINARRHPMDSCLGCFKQLWAMGQHFTYDLSDLGLYYRDYDRLMKHWHSVLPGKILDVQYEEVVDDLPSHVTRLLDYMGLPFEESCVNFHKTERAVKTSSSEQVRKPIYRSALAYWENFEELLDPLKEALGDLITH